MNSSSSNDRKLPPRTPGVTTRLADLNIDTAHRPVIFANTGIMNLPDPFASMDRNSTECHRVSTLYSFAVEAAEIVAVKLLERDPQKEQFLEEECKAMIEKLNDVGNDILNNSNSRKVSNIKIMAYQLKDGSVIEKEVFKQAAVLEKADTHGNVRVRVQKVEPSKESVYYPVMLEGGRAVKNEYFEKVGMIIGVDAGQEHCFHPKCLPFNNFHSSLCFVCILLNTFIYADSLLQTRPAKLLEKVNKILNQFAFTSAKTKIVSGIFFAEMGAEKSTLFTVIKEFAAHFSATSDGIEFPPKNPFETAAYALRYAVEFDEGLRLMSPASSAGSESAFSDGPDSPDSVESAPNRPPASPSNRSPVAENMKEILKSVKKTVRREIQREGSLIRKTVVNESQRTRAVVVDQHDETRANTGSVAQVLMESSARHHETGLAALTMIAQRLGQPPPPPPQPQQQQQTMGGSGSMTAVTSGTSAPTMPSSDGLSCMENNFEEPGKGCFICPICSSKYKLASAFHNNHTSKTKTLFLSCPPVQRMEYFLNKDPRQPASWLEAEIWNHLVDNIEAARQVAVREGQTGTYEAFIQSFSKGGGN